MGVKFNYYYGKEAEAFSFFRIPKLLFTDEAFRVLSSDAKVLYGILLDRISLSMKNGWIDEEKLNKAADSYGKSPYGEHLRMIASGNVRSIFNAKR